MRFLVTHRDQLIKCAQLQLDKLGSFTRKHVSDRQSVPTVIPKLRAASRYAFGFQNHFVVCPILRCIHFQQHLIRLVKFLTRSAFCSVALRYLIFIASYHASYSQ